MNTPVPVSYLLYTQELDEPMRRCYWQEFAANGAEHIVLNATMMAMIMEKPQLAKQFESELASAGLSFMDAHAPYGIHWDLNCVFENERPGVTVRQQLAIAIAASLGVKTMTIHVGSDNFFPDVPFEKHFSRICSMLEILLKEAEKYDITLCIENGWTRTTSTETLLSLREKFPVDNFGFCFDSGHANIMDNGRLHDRSGEAYQRWNALGVDVPPWESMEEKLQRLLPYIVNCHLHDNFGDKDQHNIPGNGNIRWQSVVDALRKAPKLQVIQSEVIIFRNALSVRENVEAVNRIFA